MTTATLNVIELKERLEEGRQSQLQVRLIKAIQEMPIVISRQGVKRGSDLNGWHSAQQAAIKAIRQVFAEAAANNHWPLCPACETGISTTDVQARRCTNCGVKLGRNATNQSD